MYKITVSKPINGISVNSDEYLLGEDGKPLTFNPKEFALFIIEHNFTRDQVMWLNFEIEEVDG